MGHRVKALAAAFLLLVTATVSAASGVIVDGREWRQLTETVGLTWNQVSTVCSTTTGVCSGELSGVSFDGWTWASVNDVQTLFEELIKPGTVQFPNAYVVYEAADDPDIEAALKLPKFLPTLVSPASRLIAGITRTPYSVDYVWTPYMFDRPSPTDLDRAYLGQLERKDASQPGQAVWLYRAHSQGGTSINHGLFIGAHDPDPVPIARRYDRNARTIASAFAARPNTKATVLTGDLSLDASGKPRNPITVIEITLALAKIRAQMKADDSLTIYINNHGGSVIRDVLGNLRLGDDGKGDEAIDVGEFLYDNVLAEILKSRFSGFPVTVFLDTCHGGGFWGGSDLFEVSPGRGINDLNQLARITLYAASTEAEFGYQSEDVSLSFWGQALKEALERPISWTGHGLAEFLETRSKQIGKSYPVYYSLARGDSVPGDVDLIEAFVEYSADVDMDASVWSDADPLQQLDDLLAEVAGVGPGTSLSDKITIARVYYDARDVDAACDVLGAFTREVRAQSGKKLTELQSEMFGAAAEFTMKSMACTM